ncbi:MAG: polysaccharide deacetylase family protein [Desulfobacteraceae bacterium]
MRPWTPFTSWDSQDVRVEHNTHRILDLLDSIDLINNEHNNNAPQTSKPKATFFLLGWIAKRFSHLVREIDKRGHEVASHGFDHQLCYTQSEAELSKDLVDSKKLLEDIISKPIWGYRAPSFSISNSVLKIIKSCGYLYDSSFNSFDRHGRYGYINIADFAKKGSVYQVDNNFYEVPLSNLLFYNTVLPWAGGGYFRFLPFSIFKKGVEHIIEKNDTYIFYAHPWEFDPDQPVVKQVSAISKFKHYINLSKTTTRLASLLDYFSNCRFLTCHSYLKEIWGENESFR